MAAGSSGSYSSCGRRCGGGGGGGAAAREGAVRAQLVRAKAESEEKAAVKASYSFRCGRTHLDRPCFWLGRAYLREAKWVSSSSSSGVGVVVAHRWERSRGGRSSSAA